MRLNCMFQTSPLSRLIKTSPATHLCWNVYARKKGKKPRNESNSSRNQINSAVVNVVY